MTKLFKTLAEGTPSQIHDEVFDSLNEVVETHLQEQRKLIIAKMFGTELQLGEKVQRKPWTKQAIKEALVEAASNQSLYPINENYGKINHMHYVAQQHGFQHKSSYPANRNGQEGHVNVYTHANGHKAYIHTDQDYQLITGSGTHLHGSGHQSLKHHMKHIDEMC